MRDIARRTKQERGIAGRVRDLVAQSLHISSSRIAKYDSILNNLIPSLMEEIKANRLSISTAYDLSGLPADRQQASYDFYLNHGKLPSESAPSGVFPVSYTHLDMILDIHAVLTEEAPEPLTYLHRLT